MTPGPLAYPSRSPYTGCMENDSGKRRDRYDTSGNPEAEYVDADKTVLINKMRITDLEAVQVQEEEALARAYEALFGEVR